MRPRWYRKPPKIGTPHPEKTTEERFVTPAELRRILDEIDNCGNDNAKRDHAAVFLGFYLGLRASEACAMERAWFREIESGVVRVARRKRLDRVPWSCPNPECQRRLKVSADKIGKTHRCPRCGTEREVQARRRASREYRLVAVPVIEDHVLVYLSRYLHDMPGNRRWLLEGRKGKPLTTRQLARVWKSYATAAGLSSRVSYHALRHGRGAQLWDLFKDQVMVKEMLGHSSLEASKFYLHLGRTALEERKRVLEEAV